MTHVFNADSDNFRAEQIGDDDQGLSGDLSEEDILDLYRDHILLYYNIFLDQHCQKYYIDQYHFHHD